jgi:MFS family permease
VIAYFALLGMAEGVWVVHIPVAQARLHLSDGPLGAALLAGPAAVVMMMPVAGRLADRFGSARIARTACIVVAFLPAVLDSAGTLSMLLVGLLAFGAVGGLLAVSMNAQAVLVERIYGRPLMASFHASYSLAGLCGALLGGVLAWGRAGPVTTCLVVALPAAAVAAVAGRRLMAEPAVICGGLLEPAPERRRLRPGRLRPGRSGRGELRRGRLRRGELRRGTLRRGELRRGTLRRGTLRRGTLRRGTLRRGTLRRGKFRRGGLGSGAAPGAGSGRGSPRFVALGLLALCCLLSEGTAGNWSAVYLRNNLRIPSGFAVSGFAAFSIAMTVGRLLGDRLATRFGPVRLVRGCGLLAATSLAAGLASNDPVAAVAGFALFGAGLSCTIPQLFSAAGNEDPDQPATGLGRVAGLGYIGLVGGPVLIGACAALTGLPVALGIPVVLGLCVAASARVLDPLRLPGQIPSGQAADVVLTLSTGTLSTGALTTAALIAEALGTGALGTGALGTGALGTGALGTGALSVEAPGTERRLPDHSPADVDSPGRTAQQGHGRVVAADRAYPSATPGARTAEQQSRVLGLHPPPAHIGRVISPRP